MEGSHDSSSSDVIGPGHGEVTCPGDGQETGPITGCVDEKKAGFSLGEHVNQIDCRPMSKVKHCHSPDGHCTIDGQDCGPIRNLADEKKAGFSSGEDVNQIKTDCKSNVKVVHSHGLSPDGECTIDGQECEPIRSCPDVKKAGFSLAEDVTQTKTDCKSNVKVVHSHGPSPDGDHSGSGTECGPIRSCPDIKKAGFSSGEDVNQIDTDTNCGLKVKPDCTIDGQECGPISGCVDIKEAGISHGGDVTQTKSDCVSKVQHCNCSCVAVDTDCHFDERPSCKSDRQEADLTSDLTDDDDDDAFVTSPAKSLPQSLGNRNTFACGRRQSAPGQMEEGDVQSRRPEIMERFNSQKQRSLSNSVAGWKLFGKVPPKQSPTKQKQARTIQQEFVSRQVAARCSPTHNAPGQRGREPLSTTALILEQRPPNLPAKSAEECQRHREQYEEMVAGAKRRELREAEKKLQQRKQKVLHEEEILNASLVWNKHILPHWDSMKLSRRAGELWWDGLPPSVRGKVWSLSIGNELNITEELYGIFLCRAKEKWRLRDTQEGAGPDGESSLSIITQEISRTFPSLCVFQKGGPLHDQLQSILGAYTCYRPDVGYVQGMSSMAAMFLLNMNQTEAFICFSNIINKPLQLVFIRGEHQQMCQYFSAFQTFFQDSLPRLFLHFQTAGLTPDLYLMDWLLSVFLKPLPLDVASRVWDVWFRDGEEFLFRTALGILRVYEETLLGMDMICMAQFLSRPPDDTLLCDRLFSCIQATPMICQSRKWSQVLCSCRESDRSGC